MARSGVPRKENKHGRTPNTGGDWHDVVDEPYDGPSPDLPARPRRKKWHPMVETWWALVRRMPHCALWTATDWQYALELAFLKCAYWEMFDEGEATAAQATEIRRREDQLGTTAEARRKLLIRYVDPEPDDIGEDEPERDIVVSEETAATAEHTATVTPLADRRSRLTRKTG